MENITAWAPPALPTLSAPPLQEWMDEDDPWLRHKVSTLLADDPLAVLMAAGQTLRLSRVDLSRAADVAEPIPQLEWALAIPADAASRAADLLRTAAEQLHESLRNLVDDEVLNPEELRTARTTLLRWRDDLRAAEVLLLEADRGSWYASVRAALDEVDSTLKPLCALWGEEDVHPDEQLERAASADPLAWWARTGDPLWELVSDDDDDDDDDDAADGYKGNWGVRGYEDPDNWWRLSEPGDALGRELAEQDKDSW